MTNQHIYEKSYYDHNYDDDVDAVQLRHQRGWS